MVFVTASQSIGLVETPLGHSHAKKAVFKGLWQNPSKLLLLVYRRDAEVLQAGTTVHDDP